MAAGKCSKIGKSSQVAAAPSNFGLSTQHPACKCHAFDTPFTTIPLRNSRRAESDSELIGTKHLQPGRPN